MDSLINSVHSALITVNEGWQLSHVSSADFFLFFFYEEHRPGRILNLLQRLKATLLF